MEKRPDAKWRSVAAIRTVQATMNAPRGKAQKLGRVIPRIRINFDIHPVCNAAISNFLVSDAAISPNIAAACATTMPITAPASAGNVATNPAIAIKSPTPQIRAVDGLVRPQQDQRHDTGAENQKAVGHKVNCQPPVDRYRNERFEDSGD